MLAAKARRLLTPRADKYFRRLTIGSDGIPLIIYHDATNGDLKVIHHTGQNIAFAIDSVGLVGTHTSVTIGVDGFALISYHDATNGDLKVAHLSNVFGVPFHRRR